MTVERVDIVGRSPFAHGYQRLDGVLRFAVHPEMPANASIVDLGSAPRDADGCVRFEADFCLLEPPRPSGRLLVMVVNRGRYGLIPFSIPSRPPPRTITDDIDPGDGFLLHRGWHVLFCGWQWDVMRQPGLLGLSAPLADVEPGRVLVRFQPSTVRTEQLLSHWPLDPAPDQLLVSHKPYAAADGPAQLMALELGAPTRGEVPATQWSFSDDRERIRMPEGFRPGTIYEALYTTGTVPVVGCGLLAIRDAAAHFGREVDATFGFGVSQTGRFLRQFLHDGMNVSEDGTPVFDGLMPHVAGARRGEFNHRFAQPSVQHAMGFGHLPPFDTGELVERAGATVKVIETNSSSEYWRSDASLVHTSHPDVRQYLFAGTMHVPGFPALLDGWPDLFPGVRCANPLTTVNCIPLQRAAIANLDAWVCDGLEPPASTVPRGCADREAVLERCSSFSAMRVLDPCLLPVLHELDLGADTDRGIGRFPAKEGAAVPSGVSDVDADGNELDGIRLPDLTVPLATHTGWNPAHPSMGMPGQGVDMLGSTAPFPRTEAERQATGDRRPSVEARYADRDDYLGRVGAAAQDLVEHRFLLDGDVAVVVDAARRAWDLFTTVPPVGS